MRYSKIKNEYKVEEIYINECIDQEAKRHSVAPKHLQRTKNKLEMMAQTR